MDIQQFTKLMMPAIDLVADHGVDEHLESALRDALGSEGEWYTNIEAACRQAVEDGWMAAEGEGPRRFGRIVEPGDATHNLSIDVVDITDQKGPHHTHPNGEICMVMPIDDKAKFDGRGRGWCVYQGGSGHNPTVTEGRALVLYMLPAGRIDWTDK